MQAAVQDDKEREWERERERMHNARQRRASIPNQRVTALFDTAMETAHEALQFFAVIILK